MQILNEISEDKWTDDVGRLIKKGKLMMSDDEWEREIVDNYFIFFI